jgi:hypothetical protein
MVVGIGKDHRASSLANQQWLRPIDWISCCPLDKRWTLAQLGVSDAISADSHQAGSGAFAGIAKLLERSCAKGPMRNAPIGLILSDLAPSRECDKVCLDWRE